MVVTPGHPLPGTSSEWASDDPREQERLRVLAQYVELPPQPDDSVLGALTRLLARACGTSMAFVTVVSAHQTWPLAWTGFPAPSYPRGRTLSDRVLTTEQPVVIGDLSTVPWASARVDTTGVTGLRAYAGVPLRHPDGPILGVVLVADNEPRTFTAEHVGLLELVAHQVMTELMLRRAPRGVDQLSDYSAPELQGLLALTKAVSRDLAPVDALALLLGRVRSLLRVDSARVLFTTPDGKGLTGGIALGLAQELADRTVIPVGSGYAGRIAATREPLVVEDLTMFPVHSPLLRASGLRSLAGVPLVVGDRLVGVMHVGSREVGAFNHRHVPLLEEIGARVAASIEAARHDAALEAERQRLAILVDAIIDPLWTGRPLRDESGAVVDIVPTEVNRAHQAAFGTPVGRRAMLAERSSELFDAACRVAATGASETLERVYLAPHPEGTSEVHGYLDVRLARIGDDLVVSWRDVTMQVKVEETLRQQALYDPLTGLPNRTLFLERLSTELRRMERHPGTLGVMFLDLDRFKDVNDTHGHDIGDTLLRQVSQRLRSTVRPSDMAARLSGDEFVVLCPEIVDPEDLVLVAERVLATVNRPLALGPGFTVRPNASIGVAATDDPAMAGEALLRNADEAMYAAKRHGGQRVTTYRPAMDRRSGERLAVEMDLHSALEQGWLRLHYQPVVDLRDGRVVEAEALLRIEHPTRGLLMPSSFIAVAESSHLMVPIGAWVLDEACRQLAEWRRVQPLRMGVNVAARQVQELRVGEQLHDAVVAAGVSSKDLSVEVTEHVLLNADNPVATALQGLHDDGARLTLDDFGTGYSSLTHLHRFTVDAVKIDRSFVASLVSDSRSETIVTGVLGLADGLGIEVIAEGIETEEQRRRLVELGCRLGQGYLFSRPVPADAFSALLIP